MVSVVLMMIVVVMIMVVMMVWVVVVMLLMVGDDAIDGDVGLDDGDDGRGAHNWSTCFTCLAVWVHAL